MTSAVYQQTRRWLDAEVFATIIADLRTLIRIGEGRAPQPSAAVIDSRTLRSTPESGSRAGDDGAKRQKGSKGTRTSDQQLSLALPTKQDEVSLPPTSAWQRVSEAYRTIGVSLQQHPVALLRHQLPGPLVTSIQLGQLPNGMSLRIPGLVVCRQRPETAKGITFLSIEDEDGLFNVIAYPALYEEQRPIVRSASFVIVYGRLQIQDENINIIARRFEPIDTAIMDDQPSWFEQDDRNDEVEMTLLEFGETIRRADVLAVQPKAHSYR